MSHRLAANRELHVLGGVEEPGLGRVEKRDFHAMHAVSARTSISPRHSHPSIRNRVPQNRIVAIALNAQEYPRPMPEVLGETPCHIDNAP